jgi:hypothetical protein
VPSQVVSHRNCLANSLIAGRCLISGRAQRRLSLCARNVAMTFSPLPQIAESIIVSGQTKGPEYTPGFFRAQRGRQRKLGLGQSLRNCRMSSQSGISRVCAVDSMRASL